MEDQDPAPEFYIQVLEEDSATQLLSDDDGGRLVEGSKRQLEAAASLVRAAGGSLYDSFQAARPDKGAVEFNLAFTGKSGIPVLASGSVEASIKITLEWERRTAG